DRDDVDDVVLGGNGAGDTGRIEDAAQVGIADFVAGNGHLVGGHARARLAGGNIDDDTADVVPRHALGRLDGGADRRFGTVEVDQGTVADPLRCVVADADDA